MAMDRIKLFADLTVSVGSRKLIERGTLEVQRGTVTALMGPSGVGKSILMDLVFDAESGARGGVALA